MMELTPETSKQTMIFENSDPRHADLLAVIDKVNKTYGRQNVKLAAQNLGRALKMKRERLSPCYTTRIDDILRIHAKQQLRLNIILFEYLSYLFVTWLCKRMVKLSDCVPEAFLFLCFKPVKGENNQIRLIIVPTYFIIQINLACKPFRQDQGKPVPV